MTCERSVSVPTNLPILMNIALKSRYFLPRPSPLRTMRQTRNQDQGNQDQGNQDQGTITQGVTMLGKNLLQSGATAFLMAQSPNRAAVQPNQALPSFHNLSPIPHSLGLSRTVSNPFDRDLSLRDTPSSNNLRPQQFGHVGGRVQRGTHPKNGLVFREDNRERWAKDFVNTLAQSMETSEAHNQWKTLLQQAPEVELVTTALDASQPSVESSNAPSTLISDDNNVDSATDAPPMSLTIHPTLQTVLSNSMQTAEAPTMADAFVHMSANHERAHSLKNAMQPLLAANEMPNLKSFSLYTYRFPKHSPRHGFQISVYLKFHNPNETSGQSEPNRESDDLDVKPTGNGQNLTKKLALTALMLANTAVQPAWARMIIAGVGALELGMLNNTPNVDPLPQAPSAPKQPIAGFSIVLERAGSA